LELRSEEEPWNRGESNNKDPEKGKSLGKLGNKIEAL
jgi:hypothetical protein